MTRRAMPYRLPASETVNVGGWVLALGDELIPMPDRLPDWDYQTNLVIRRDVEIDTKSLRVGAGLSPDVPLALAVVWTASGSGLKAAGYRTALSGPDRDVCQVEVRIPGTEVGGRLTLETAVVLDSRNVEQTAATPRRAGSVLWRDSHEVQLQGDAPQFPISVIDFGKTSFPNDAAWHVQISTNLMSATMGGMILLVNERNLATVRALQNAARPRTVDKAILSAVYCDVARTMVEHGLRSDELVDGDTSYPEGTLGATIVSLLDRFFPGVSREDLKLRMEHSPTHFASELRAAVRLFEEIE
ncbi:hypothetical protein [Kribbella shirazensis]|uniref:Uncharacterized protein n=1 Tax=Kribbella shirazensis TaxID=1105143 RepID=A0A7X6A1S0_9ACTN|nr:hypothetical protein [Kribbella shirazensis]NIK58248.1 hypothetical protein [Kribbella shirazensis]